MMTDLVLDSSQMTVAFRQRTFSPVEVMRAIRHRNMKLAPVVNAFCEVDEEDAMSTACEAERQWMRRELYVVFHGVPVLTKVPVATAGLPARHGPRIASSTRENADVLTTTSDFGNRIVTDCPLKGVTRNPWGTRLSGGRRLPGHMETAP
ncbi:hypothetical protein G5S35_31115 [Paraburkholderia tropica]|uniref:amidase family protein n=1 Tax=Paraburkholderia tropica TaxID=92647 RepID=UPI001600BFC3|nr:amidase family protein [Paraburkholderia tropica]QNB16112.1 hypothetical protein G5S35_31115 [Paraburkholderia tropica]